MDESQLLILLIKIPKFSFMIRIELIEEFFNKSQLLILLIKILKFSFMIKIGLIGEFFFFCQQRNIFFLANLR